MSGPTRSMWYRMQNGDYPTLLGPQPMKHVFSAIVGYFDTHPGFSRVASYYGQRAPGSGEIGKGFGPMTDFSSNPHNGCWAIWRATASSVQYDIALIAADGADITAYASGAWEPEGPLFSFTGIHFAGAYFSGSGGAWNGTTNNDGADSFTTPWKSGSIPTIRCNGVGGGNEPLGNAVARLNSVGAYEYFLPGSVYNIFITGDNDITYVVLPGGTLSDEIYRVSVIGLYQPVASSSNVPLTQFKLGAAYQADAVRGLSVGSTVAGTGGGGIVCTSSGSVNVLRLEYPSFMLTDGYRMSRIQEEDRIWEFPIKLYSYETGNYGYRGTVPEMTVGADSAGPTTFRFYKKKTRLLAPISTPGDLTNEIPATYLVVCLPWNSGVLTPREW